MIGRGTYGRPWFVHQVCEYLKGRHAPEPSLPEQRDIMLNHYEEMLSLYGHDAGVRIARKHIGWYVGGLHSSAEFRSSVNKLTDANAVKETIRTYYDTLLSRGITSRTYEKVTDGE